MADTQVKWWQGCLIYEVYMRSYMDANGDGIGDLAGLTSKLDYIKSLNVDAIWLTPFYPSPMKDFGYDVSDYRGVDARFGTMDDFDALVAGIHQRGMKLITDHVWSHSSDQHPWFIASADPDHPEHETYRDWYVWYEGDPGTLPNNWHSMFAGPAWTWVEKRGAWYLHNFLREQPDLNWHNRYVREAIFDIARFWLDKGVDGFRLDVCNFYTHDPQFRDNPARPAEEDLAVSLSDTQEFAHYRCVHNINQPENLDYLEELDKVFDDYPEAMTLGEVAGIEGGLKGAAEYVMPGRRLDTIYSGFLLYPSYPDAAAVARLLKDAQDELSGKQICWVLGTHDFERVATRWQVDDAHQHDMVIQAMAFLLAMPGIACVYQGDELGLPQGAIKFDDMRDPQGINFKNVAMSRDGCRIPFPWTASGPSHGFNDTGESWLPMQPAYAGMAADAQEKDDHSVLAETRRLTALRRSIPAWRYGVLADVAEQDGVVSFTRLGGDAAVRFVFNFSGADARLDGGDNAETVYWAYGAAVADGALALAPYGVAILQK